jgi:hypothetical protein
MNMYIAIMSVTFGQIPYALSIQSESGMTAEMGRLKVKPGSRYAAESRMPARH